VSKSDTEWAIGPGEAEMNLRGGGRTPLFFMTISQPSRLTLPGVGLKLLTPVKAAGILRLPARSDPIANGTHKPPTRPASPPELPPQDLDLSSGLRAKPHNLFSEWIVRSPY